MQPQFAVLAVTALAVTGILVPVASGQEDTEGVEGIGVTPATLDIRSAQADQTYMRQLVVQNRFDSATVVNVTPIGETGNWTAVGPARNFEIPARSNAVLTLSIAVPADVEDGTYSGAVQVAAEPKDEPDESGAALRFAATASLNVTVGGDVVSSLTGANLIVSDVEEGTQPLVILSVLNEGNQRETARVSARVLGSDNETVILNGTGRADVLPGETADVRVNFPRALSIGQYTVTVMLENDAEPREYTGEFRVVPQGELGKSGTFRFIAHEPWVEPDANVDITAVFANTGDTAISAARFVGEVRHDGELVAVLESETVSVPAGEDVELATNFTAGDAGVYTISGSVEYDGVDTPVKRSILNVQSGDDSGGAPDAAESVGIPPIAAIVGAVVVLALIGVLVAVIVRKS